MGKCIVCGKKSLFLKVDIGGRCQECAERIAEEEKKEFEFYYTNLLRSFEYVQETIEFNNLMSALEVIPKIKDKVEVCETLKLEIYNPKYEERFARKLEDNISYRDDFNRRHGIGRLEEWGISVFAEPITKKYSIDKIREELGKVIDSCKMQWIRIIERVQDSAEFQRWIDDIPSVEVKLSDKKFDKKMVSELDDLIKYTNITPKTSFDKIGSFVVVDTETTGLSSVEDNLIEVAAIRFEDWSPVEKFHTLINPGKHIPDKVSAINNITDDMVADAPNFSQVIESLSVFIGKSNVVGHNLPFDLKFLYRNGYDFTIEKRRYYDTCEISKKILKKPKMKWDKEYEEYIINDNYDYDVENYKLTTLCDYYRVRDNLFAHRALSDALATGLIFKKLAQAKIYD